MKDFHDEGAGQATRGSANAERPGASEVSRIFAEGNKLVARKGFMDGGEI
jgi:hypothetical protein